MPSCVIAVADWLTGSYLLFEFRLHGESQYLYQEWAKRKVTTM